jgi:hypothetical protein
MSVADTIGPEPGVSKARVRDLLRRCGSTQDRAERAALLSRAAFELDQAAQDITAHRQEHDITSREVAAALQGQAIMARLVADLERRDHARLVDRSRTASR